MADVQPVLDFFHAAYVPEGVGLVPHKNMKLHVPPSQFARASAVSYGAGPKACAQCGTTRTPQWREGPEGPKTLCNACGVKRVRQMRTVMDGNKRRSNTNTSKSSSALLRQESMEPQISDSLDLQRQDSYYKRPVRRAAARAACRTAEFASTGEWLDDEEDGSYPYISSQSTGSADSAENHSDSAEEVAWIPQHRAAHPMPPSPMGTATAVGVECAAAVNLLSMSVHDSELRRHHASRPAALAHAHAAASVSSREPCKVNADSYLQMSNTAMKWNYAMPPHAKAADSIQETLRLLPEEKHSELLTIKEELDTSSREAAAADAAVAAVAKILAMKQAAAIRARTAASCAAKRMHEFMADLDEEYHWSRNPKKPRSL